MKQKACPKCGLVSDQKQYICPYCWAKLRSCIASIRRRR